MTRAQVLLAACSIVAAQGADVKIDEESILHWHNVYRCMHDVPALKWNEELAEKAQQWADELNGELKLSPMKDRYDLAGFRYVGELVAKKTALSGPEAVTTWYNDVKDTDNGKVEKFNATVAHYTQVVWKSTTDLGCGSNADVVVCMYGPGGNIMKRFPTNVLPTGGKSLKQCGGNQEDLVPTQGMCEARAASVWKTYCGWDAKLYGETAIATDADCDDFKAAGGTGAAEKAKNECGSKCHIFSKNGANCEPLTTTPSTPVSTQSPLKGWLYGLLRYAMPHKDSKEIHKIEESIRGVAQEIKHVVKEGLGDKPKEVGKLAAAPVEALADDSSAAGVSLAVVCAAVAVVTLGTLVAVRALSRRGGGAAREPLLVA